MDGMGIAIVGLPMLVFGGVYCLDLLKLALPPARPCYCRRPKPKKEAGSSSNRQGSKMLNFRGVWWRSHFILIFSGWWFQVFFMFIPNLGKEMIQFDEHIFRMGWNHQLVFHFFRCKLAASFMECFSGDLLVFYVFLLIQVLQKWSKWWRALAFLVEECWSRRNVLGWLYVMRRASAHDLTIKVEQLSRRMRGKPPTTMAPCSFTHITVTSFIPLNGPCLPLGVIVPFKQVNKHFLGGGFKHFFFHPYLGKIPILTNIFQRGWNHQLVLKTCGKLVHVSMRRRQDHETCLTCPAMLVQNVFLIAMRSELFFFQTRTGCFFWLLTQPMAKL